MGRPSGSKNKTLNDEIEAEFRANGLMDDGDGTLRNTVSVDDLRAYIERVENVTSEIADLQSDRREIFREIKDAGIDAATVRAIIKRRAIDPDKRALMDELMDQYTAALGDFAETPLGVAGANRVREGIGA